MDVKAIEYKRYFCSFTDCEASYNKQWKLDAHICKHTGVKSFTCEREGCSKSFCSKYHLDRHDLSHSGVRPFRCSFDGCTESFTTNSNKDRHFQRCHADGKKTYACTFEGCNLVFKKNKQLRAHMCEQHTLLPPYLCPFDGCQMRFTFPSKLKRHEKVHTGYPCTEEGCGFIGKTWTDYLKHRKDSHRALIKCEHCDKSFRDSWFLRQHQRVHSDTRMVLKCPRDGCERTYTTLFNLQSHINSFHEGLQPFTCTHEGCGKTFAMKKSLQRHRVIHDPEKKKLRKPRPKRSLASRLSGFNTRKKTANIRPKDSPGCVKSSVQDNNLNNGALNDDDDDDDDNNNNNNNNNNNAAITVLPIECLIKDITPSVKTLRQ